MNERFFLKILLVLFCGLIAAEVLVVALFGLKLELILLCFIVVAALTGILFVLRLLLAERNDIDSVSMRRAKEKSSGIMQDRLKEYSVDEEFLGGKDKHRAGSEEPVLPVRESIEDAIRVHAEMYGGLGELLQMIEKIDDASFERFVKQVGFGEISREEVMLKITLMTNGELNAAECNRVEQSIIEGHSMDKASFDDYIRRCMNVSDEESESADKGFSVELDSAALSKGTVPMPTDFSHDPKAVFSKLNKPGERT
ncbi:MAG: hypothetical protein HKK66_01190 [Chlorobiaceae bacterium]|jgi:hypothetical protein|nr:hypothetical protein [Chlorobiaceae bacterium]